MKQPWLVSKRFDLGWIIGPAFISSAFVLIWEQFGNVSRNVSGWQWFFLVVCIDVAHVYSTAFRTYLDSEERARYRRILFAIPLIAWISGVMIYSISAAFFWTVLAYVAVFHFVRQQYGFMALYRRSEDRGYRWLDVLAVYAASVYPLIYWHANLPRSFSWFVPGDFVLHVSPLFEQLSRVVWVALLLSYSVKEFYIWKRKKFINFPKMGIIYGTALAWYVGIISFNADLPFTLTNVITHGVPYIALIWAYQRNKTIRNPNARSIGALICKPLLVPVFVGVLILIAYIEEGLWDGFVWRDHGELFGWASGFPKIQEAVLLSLIVPLLAVPQATHYLIDAFIWRIRKPKSELHQFISGAVGNE